MGEDKSILQVGGLGGLLAGIVSITFLIGVALSGGAGTTEALLRKFQEIGRGYMLVVGLGMVGFLLSVPLFLALHRASRRAGPATALVGGVLGVSGAFFAAANWAIVMAGFPVLSDLWAAAPDAQKEMVLIAAQAVELGVTHSLALFGGLLIGLAFASFGWSLLARSDARGYGWASLVLGLLVAVSWVAVAALNETGMEVAFLAIGSIVTWALFFLLGWKVYSLSRTV